MYFNTRCNIRAVGKYVAILAALALLSIWPKRGAAAILPTLPTLFDTTYAAPTGITTTVNAGGNLQTAINNAALGDTIVLQAGATFTGPFTLPNKASGSGWIYIRSSAYASLPPPGSRVSPFYAPSMPKIVITNLAASAAIVTATQAHHFRFIGIEILPVAGNYVYDLVDIGNTSLFTSMASLPHDIVFDRCYVHSDPSAGGRRGIAMNGINIAVIDSYIADFREVGADTQAIWSFQGSGPLKIVNNFLEAASENMLFGGADPRIPNSVPSDIEIRHNHFFKPLALIGAGMNVKNLLEFKNAQRVLVEGNIFENNWPDGQNGFALLITPRNQDGTAPWCVTQDITIRLNKFINVGQGMNISGRDSAPGFTTQISYRLLIENNVIQVTGLNNADGRIFQTINGPVDLTIRHNTAFTIPTGYLAFSQNSPQADRFDFRDNILSNGSVGFAGTGTGTGTATLNAYFTNYTFTNNAIIGGSGTYPTGNFFPASTTAVGFVNFAAGNYTLTAGSTFHNAGTDGKDLGADIAAVVAAGAGGIVSGLPAPANAKAQ